jgi:hypothetical protein
MLELHIVQFLSKTYFTTVRIKLGSGNKGQFCLLLCLSLIKPFESG